MSETSHPDPGAGGPGPPAGPQAESCPVNPTAPRQPATTGEPVAGNYFVSTYPPFFHWSQEEVAAAEAALDRQPAGPVPMLGLYVHVPFCVRRCKYCYYLSYDDRSTEMEPYLGAVTRELSALMARPALSGRQPDFVYFGGGTPSVLSAAHAGQVLDWLRRIAPWADGAEVSFEVAPRTVTERKLAALKAGGVTRISMGVQQMDDEVLKVNGRVHLVADVERAYALVQAAGFQVVNLDLMVGLPGESDATFMGSLDRVLTLAPDSITIYQTELPLNTPLYRAVRDGVQDEPVPAWGEKHERLGRGFEHLEAAGYTLRSAYAAVRDTEKVRFTYQDAQYRGADLLGIGASSFSYLGGIHYQNLADMDAYQDAVHSGRLPLMRAHVLTPGEQAIRQFVLQLKLGRVDLAALKERYGFDVAQRLLPVLVNHAQRGYLTFDDKAVTVSRKGLLNVDRWLRAYFLKEHRGPRLT